MLFRDKYRKTLVLGVLAALTVEILLLGGVFFFALQGNLTPATAAEPAVAQSPTAGFRAASPVGTDIVADVVARTGPAVVKIETAQKVSQRANPFFSDPFFRQFFGSTPGAPRVRERVREGLGSGFIISDDGYILTNEHVIRGATEIKVYLSDSKKPLDGKVIGSDFELDLAVLKVDAKQKLPYLELGSSKKTRVGEWVIAIGNPYGLDHTVTTGVVSAKGRPVNVEKRHYKNLLQTDASINPGNSGGPLLNLEGKVIGINTAVNAQAQGIGFAIPSGTVKSVVDTLINEGKISRPWMGVFIQNLTPQLARALELDSEEGALIAGVVPDSPADEAGLEQGDVILEINRQAVKNAGDVSDSIKKMKVGDKALVLVETGGGRKYVTLTLEEKSSK